ncbi:phage tail protein [Nocardioides abyssi]|uniref:Tail fiber protein n=1 Tax=Nocardioides abyssi TaxID=3058370 RepID=A0ABT8EYW3_9ACTN|nr:tail fiber protein [Nocardioides abyssi]MDN4163328.1 tail fiber protein [Nocardioides abyssi]
MDHLLGSLTLSALPFAPRGWALCNGQILPIAQNQALFSLLGTTYGGNGTVTFALPDLRGRVPVGAGVDPRSGWTYAHGQVGGAEAVTLGITEMPAHTHGLLGSEARGVTGSPVDAALASGAGWYAAAPAVAMAPAAVAAAGGGQPHSNVQPSLVLSWLIAVQGVFPSRN